MPIFRPGSNLARSLILVGAVFGLTGISLAAWGFKWSLMFTKTGNFVEQPVPFSHAHHVGGLGIDCRYCHTSAETSSNAGFPPTQTCMTCHSQIWTNAAVLEPVRRSYAEDRPLEWQKVHVIPDYVYFDHGIHVAKGVGCSTCHGAVDRMPLTTKVMPFYMKQCLECHRNPGKYLRPASEIYNMSWHPPLDPLMAQELERLLLERNRIPSNHRLTDCYVCHR